jgi:hypothetical protein
VCYSPVRQSIPYLLLPRFLYLSALRGDVFRSDTRSFPGLSSSTCDFPSSCLSTFFLSPFPFFLSHLDFLSFILSHTSLLASLQSLWLRLLIKTSVTDLSLLFSILQLTFLESLSLSLSLSLSPLQRHSRSVCVLVDFETSPF